MWRMRELRRTLAHAAGRLFFTLVFLGLLLAGMGLLVNQLASAKPNAALISAAGALVLLSALFARYGEDLAWRIKKVGPVELFEEVREALSPLDEIETTVPETFISDDNTLDIKPVELTPSERFSFEQGDLYATMLAAMGKEPARPEQRAKYFKLLFKVGACAFGQNDWPRVAARLGRLEELSDGSWRREEVLFYLGVAYCYWGMKTADPGENRRYFVAARARLLALARDKDARHRTYFFLAYAQDELGQWHEAIGSNEEALKRRPRFAPAKYNIAISRLKLDADRDAYRALEALRPDDDEIERILNWYDKDAELLPQMRDAYWRRATVRLMRDIRRRRDSGEGQ